MVRSLSAAVVGIAILAADLLAPAQAQAQPPTTAAGLLAHYHDLSRAAELVNEQLLEVQQRLAPLRRQSATARAQQVTARAAADRARVHAETAQEVDRMLATAGGAGQQDPMTVLVSGVGVDELFDRLAGASLVEAMTDERGEHYAGQADAALRQAQQAEARATRAQQQASAAETAVATEAAEVQRRKADLNRQITEVRTALDHLSPDDRALLAASEAPGGVVRTEDVLLPHGATGAALAFALAQLGRPYLWGAIGPKAYDCSGLVQTSYRAAGIGLPRVSRQQATIGVEVPRNQVRAGDLVFYYNPIHHVAIAVDGSFAVHAPSFGETVQLSPIDAIGPVTTIRRIL
ncbi:C40 family peptidase [Labedaea rhizosphaerae]|uniref:Cell wall-associated NlpC family hydrolase n=1 Tax=Labedaea rhizosphaerae TaxID=598644 RepID=A0A4R6SB58_LABRH|nr:C40 family peptidase [Labedaea rhizosphaerae]TDP96783.1 cell wall-associated NlpC family hydrolase [Labedaea rhizosphaerae]